MQYVPVRRKPDNIISTECLGLMDNVNAVTRSRIMASVRAKGNRSTEKRLRAYLVGYGFHGWRMNAIELPGKPDFVFDQQKLAIFADGCFWHSCPRCFRMPTTNIEYWVVKIRGDIERDKMVNRRLRRNGWHVLRIWEHELRESPKEVIPKIALALRPAKKP